MAQTIDGAFKIAAKKHGMSLEDYRAKREAGFKWCNNCKAWRLLGSFPLNPGHIDGHGNYCLECGRKRYVSHPRVYGPSPMRGKAMTERAKQKMREAHKGSNNHRWKGGISIKKYRDPLKNLAKRAVNHAVEAGRLADPKTLPCFDCGNPAKEYHHYRGYDQAHWLDVQALCINCHHKK